MAVKIPQSLRKMIEDKAYDHVVTFNAIATRFLGADKYPFRQPTEKRLVVRIGVDRISGMAPGYRNWS